MGKKVTRSAFLVVLDTVVLSVSQFHLRVYCVASGALKVYVYDRILALFAAVPYGPPTFEITNDDEPPVVNLAPHLTNTSLQTERGEENVRLLDELAGCKILSDGGTYGAFSHDDHRALIAQIGDVLGETFKAGIEASIHFQVSTIVSLQVSLVSAHVLTAHPKRIRALRCRLPCSAFSRVFATIPSQAVGNKC